MTEKAKTEIRLNMGQWFVTKSENHKLITPSLGSCVALCLYDSEHKIGGMAHVVLPSRVIRDIKTSKLQNEASNCLSNYPSSNYPSAKYADEVILLLTNEIIRQAGHPDITLEAKLAGGSQMFVGSQRRKSPNEMVSQKARSGFPNIGRSNADILKKELCKFNIPIVGTDLGGSCGRTVTFNTTNGTLYIRKIGSNEEVAI